MECAAPIKSKVASWYPVKTSTESPVSAWMVCKASSVLEIFRKEAVANTKSSSNGKCSIISL